MNKDSLSLNLKRKFGTKNLFAHLIILSLFLILPAKSFSFKKVEPSAELVQAAKEFNARYNNKWKINWNPKTGLLSSIDYHRTLSISGSPDRVVKTFIEENQTLMPLKVSEMGKPAISEREGFKLVEYQQVYEGIPVHWGRIKCDVTDKGELTEIVLNYYPNITLDPVPAITQETALELVKADLGVEESPDSEPTVELVIFPDYDGDYYLTWKVRISCRDPLGDWFYFVDAKTSEIIHKYNNIRY